MVQCVFHHGRMTIHRPLIVCFVHTTPYASQMAFTNSFFFHITTFMLLFHGYKGYKHFFGCNASLKAIKQ